MVILVTVHLPTFSSYVQLQQQPATIPNQNQKPRCKSIISHLRYSLYRVPHGVHVSVIPWNPHRVITINSINIVLGLLHLVGAHDTQYKHFTTQVKTQIPCINNCSLHMSFVKCILCFDICTQMALQASLKGYCLFYVNF